MVLLIVFRPRRLYRLIRGDRDIILIDHRMAFQIETAFTVDPDIGSAWSAAAFQRQLVTLSEGQIVLEIGFVFICFIIVVLVLFSVPVLYQIHFCLPIAEEGDPGHRIRLDRDQSNRRDSHIGHDNFISVSHSPVLLILFRAELYHGRSDLFAGAADKSPFVLAVDSVCICLTVPIFIRQGQDVILLIAGHIVIEVFIVFLNRLPVSVDIFDQSMILCKCIRNFANCTLNQQH